MCDLYGEVFIMKLTKEREQTESMIFIKKFKGKKFDISADGNGKIIKIITTDKEIIAYAKKLGLTNG